MDRNLIGGEEFLLNLIRNKLNFKSNGTYDGFKMHEGFLENMNLLNRFEHYMDFNMSDSVYIPIFYKGSGSLVCISESTNNMKLIEEFIYTGMTTDKIILDIIKRNNPNINDLLNEINGRDK